LPETRVVGNQESVPWNEEFKISNYEFWFEDGGIFNGNSKNYVFESVLRSQVKPDPENLNPVNKFNEEGLKECGILKHPSSQLNVILRTKSICQNDAWYLYLKLKSSLFTPFQLSYSMKTWSSFSGKDVKPSPRGKFRFNDEYSKRPYYWE